MINRARVLVATGNYCEHSRAVPAGHGMNASGWTTAHISRCDSACLIGDIALDNIDQFIAEMTMKRQLRTRFETGQLHDPLRDRIEPQSLGLLGRGCDLPGCFARGDNYRMNARGRGRNSTRSFRVGLSINSLIQMLFVRHDCEVKSDRLSGRSRNLVASKCPV